jgi:serine/threonine-protein kinase
MLHEIGSRPSLGDSIGRYRLIAELARGGMGIVYVGASQGPGGFSKLVAIKELKPELAQDGDFLTMFLDEARMAARLNHPNIVQTNDVDQHDGRHFIAMEYLEGRSLYFAQKRFATKGGLPQRVVLNVLRDVLSALDYAHELTSADGKLLGFVHRDISPQNVFLTFDGHTKVIDFGIAKARDSSLETKTGVLKGRVSYMAPEQLAHECDRRTDIFSVGVILAEAVTGRRLWHGLNEVEVLTRLVRGELPPLEGTGRLIEICRQALRPRPEDRYATAAEMRDALDEYLWTQGGPPRPREVSTVLLREFEVERNKRRALVEVALGRLTAGESGTLATLDPRETESRSIPSTSRHNASVVAPLPQPEPPPDVALRPRPSRLWLGAGVLSFTALVLAISLPRSAPIEPPKPQIAPVTHALPAPETVVLSVNVVPLNAQLFLDEELLPSNPFLGRFPKSTQTHRLRAVAPGHLAKERLVSFSDNVMIDLALAPRALPPSRPPPRAARRSEPPPARPVSVETPPVPQPARAPAGDIQPRGAGEPPRRRSIDSTNPYGDDQ